MAFFQVNPELFPTCFPTHILEHILMGKNAIFYKPDILSTTALRFQQVNIQQTMPV